MSELHQKLVLRPSVIQSRRPNNDERSREARAKKAYFDAQQETDTPRNIPIMAMSLAERATKMNSLGPKQQFRSSSYKQNDVSQHDDMLIASMASMGALDQNAASTTANGEPLFQPPNPADAVAVLQTQQRHTLYLQLQACVLAIDHLRSKQEGQKFYIPGTAAVDENANIDAKASGIKLRKSNLIGAVIDSLLKESLGNDSVVNTFQNLSAKETPFFVGGKRVSEDVDKEAEEAETAQAPENTVDIIRDVPSTYVSGSTLSEFKASAESILIETLFNIMNEANAGVFDIAKLPKQVVLEGLDVEELIDSDAETSFIEAEEEEGQSVQQDPEASETMFSEKSWNKVMTSQSEQSN
jgi:hypothetical protein